MSPELRHATASEQGQYPPEEKLFNLRSKMEGVAGCVFFSGLSGVFVKSNVEWIFADSLSIFDVCGNQ
ncbi:MAG: hypothetical protein LC660_18175, partial [Desulfobacteraceae bacterium]|nr:hypothetical protein [Desulfobacteraceae bacterium]